MAFIDSFDIGQLKVKRMEKRNEEFATRYAAEIAQEMKWMAARIRQMKPELMSKLEKAVTTSSTVEVPALNIMSFNFSRLGYLCGYTQLPVTYDYYDQRPPADTYMEYAARDMPCSFVEVEDNQYISRYAIWKSKDFTKKLAEMLELPSNAYFVVRSKKIEYNVVFDESTDVEEYDNTMSLVIHLN